MIKPAKGLPQPPRIISHHKNFPLAYFSRKKTFHSFFQAWHATSIGVSTGSVLARMENERWDYERIAGVMRNVSECRVVLADLTVSLTSGDMAEVVRTQSAIISASNYVIWELGEGNKWFVLITGLYQRAELCRYRPAIDYFVQVTQGEVRTPEHRQLQVHRAAYRTEVLREQNDRAAAAARERERARRNSDTRERLILVGGFGAVTSATYATYGALAGSAVPGIGTALGAGLGGIAGFLVGGAFGASKS
jgi:hypothetical protein